MSAVSALPDGWKEPDLAASGSLAWRSLRALRRRTLERFLDDCDHPGAAQRAAFERVLDASTGTTFASHHDLAAVRTLADYRAAVPIIAAADHEPWLRRALSGGPGVLTRHPHLAFNRTSGTTGAPKDLPVTAPWAHAVGEAQAVWVAAMIAEQPELAVFGARALTTVGRWREGRTASGVPIGSNTGRMHRAQPWWVKLRYAVPESVFGIPELDVRTYVLLRLALAVDVRSWTTANPSTILAICRAAVRWQEELARDLRDGTLRAGPAAELGSRMRSRLRPWVWRRRDLPDDPRPGAFWANLACVNCWKGGSAPFFLERLPDALGADVPIREVGVSASEGHLAVPLHSSWWGGVMHVGGHLIELLPEDGDEAVLPHEAEVGRTYRPILSTTAGLYRYDLGDRLRVEGLYRRTPVVRFVGKTADVVSLTGEKVTAEQIALAASRSLRGWVHGVSVLPHQEEMPWLEVLVEGELQGGEAERFEFALQALNGEYQSKRHTARYAPARVSALPEGTYARWRASRAAQGVADGQVKDPVIVDEALGGRLKAGFGEEL